MDITLETTKRQMDDCNKEILAITKRDKEHNQDNNFEEGHSIKRGEGHEDDGIAIASAMKVSLGNTA